MASIAHSKAGLRLRRIFVLLAAVIGLAAGVQPARGQTGAAGETTLYLPFVMQYAGLDAPTPAQGATGQSVNMYLAWQFNNPRIQQPRFTIYLAANDPTPDQAIAADLTQTVFDPPTFALDTDYYWQVVAKGSDGQQAAGPVWRFHTDDNRQPRDGSALVTVPAGEFRMGCDVANAGIYGCSNNKDTPLHTVWLDGFAIDKYEVTNAQYRACVEAGKCKRPRKTQSNERASYFYDERYNDYPVLFVSHWDAQAYCGFAGKRLPTEAEWEKAARGPVDTRIFPWGNEFPDCTRANFTEDFYDDEVYYCTNDTVAVGSQPAGASPYGAMDMAGNAFEWVEDSYNESYYASSPYLNPLNRSGNYFVIRGGSYRPRLLYLRVSHRHFGHHGDRVGDDSPYYRNYQTGFRCARSLPK
jgi:formylglycine-generating enzyme required for sulfatase activity